MEGLYYLCSENKGPDQLRGTDQLRSYREADLCLCFHICKKPVFSRHGSYVISLKRESGRFSFHFREVLQKCIEYIGKLLIHFREIS